jgi:hypothetical protein
VKQLEADEARMRTAYIAAMDELRIDALAFPTTTLTNLRRAMITAARFQSCMVHKRDFGRGGVKSLALPGSRNRATRTRN